MADNFKAIGIVIVIVMIVIAVATIQVSMWTACLDGNLGACMLVR